MSAFEEFKIPIAVRLEDPQRMAWCEIDARIEVASSEEAPVVARWRKPGSNHHIDLRAWKGGLVGAEGVGGGVHGLVFGDRVYMPLRGWGGLSRQGRTEKVGDARTVPQLHQKIEAVRERIGNSVLVDGVAFVPTDGPLIAIKNRFGSHVSSHGDDDVWVSAESPSFRMVDEYEQDPPWSEFDREAIKAIFDGGSPFSRVHFTDNGFEVFSHEGWGVDAIRRRSEERLLDHLVRVMGQWMERVPLSKTSPRMMDALLEIREARSIADFGEKLGAARRFAEAVQQEFRGSPIMERNIFLGDVSLALIERNPQATQELQGFALPGA